MRSIARLTITLANDVLQQVDQTMDGKIVRNRSHTIEVLLEESLRPRVTTAEILAGDQMKTAVLPPQLPVGGTPFVSNTLDLLKRHDVKLIYVLGGEFPSQLRDGIGKSNHHGIVLQYIYKRKHLGNAGAD